MKTTKPLTALIIHNLPANLSTLHKIIDGDKSAIWRTLKRLEERGCVAQGLDKEWMYLHGYELTEIEKEVEDYYLLQQIKQSREKNPEDNLPEILSVKNSSGKTLADVIAQHLEEAPKEGEIPDDPVAYFNEQRQTYVNLLLVVQHLHQNR